MSVMERLKLQVARGVALGAQAVRRHFQSSVGGGIASEPRSETAKGSFGLPAAPPLIEMGVQIERIALTADIERAKHVVVRSYSQSGNDYRPEVECRCGWKGFADDHQEHVARALLAAFEDST